MDIEKIMYEKVTIFIKQRYQNGWGGAAIMYTKDEKYLISVAFESANGSACLCMETGAMCEAQKYNKKITHSLCVVRNDEKSIFRVLTPCGICQERLLFWGNTVKVGISTETGILNFITLKEMNPYPWTIAYKDSELEHYIDSSEIFRYIV